MEWDNSLLGPLPYLWLCSGTRRSQDRGRQDPPPTSQWPQEPRTPERVAQGGLGGQEKEGRMGQVEVSLDLQVSGHDSNNSLTFRTLIRRLINPSTGLRKFVLGNSISHKCCF